MDDIVLDKEALEKMGLYSKIIHLIEYDMHSELKMPKDITIEEARQISQRNKLSRRFRNDLVYLLKYKLFASQHLQSSWIVEDKYLDKAKVELGELIKKMKERGFHDADRRIKIIRVVTTPEDNQHYNDKKAEFLMSFLNEANGYCEKAESEGEVKKGSLWRVTKAIEIIEILKEEVREHKLYRIIGEEITKLKERAEKTKTLLNSEGEGDED